MRDPKEVDEFGRDPMNQLLKKLKKLVPPLRLGQMPDEPSVLASHIAREEGVPVEGVKHWFIEWGGESLGADVKLPLSRLNNVIVDSIPFGMSSEDLRGIYNSDWNVTEDGRGWKAPLFPDSTLDDIQALVGPGFNPVEEKRTLKLEKDGDKIKASVSRRWLDRGSEEGVIPDAEASMITAEKALNSLLDSVSASFVMDRLPNNPDAPEYLAMMREAIAGRRRG